MAIRKPKPTQLKEQTSVKPLVDLSRLFAPANAAMPVVAESTDDKTLKLTDPRLKEKPEAIRRDETTNVSLAVTRATIVKPLAPKPQPKPKAEPAPKKTNDSSKYAVLLFVPALLMLGYIALAPSGPTPTSGAAKSRLSAEQIQERLNFHRSLTGSRLNRERIDVQIENQLEAPGIGSDARRVKTHDMMNGLPLVGEAPVYSHNAKTDLPVDSSHPDARIMYGLQEEQDRLEFDKRAQQEWLKEFKANARRDGYDVQVDQFGNVKAKRLPAESFGPVDQNAGARSGVR